MADPLRSGLLDHPPQGVPIPHIGLQDRHPGNAGVATRTGRQDDRDMPGVGQASGDGMTDEPEPAGDEYAQHCYLALARALSRNSPTPEPPRCGRRTPHRWRTRATVRADAVRCVKSST